MNRTTLSKCPTCGSRRIKHVCRDVAIDVASVHFVAPDIEFDDCPDCGEQIYDVAAMEKIEAHRPSTGRAKPSKRKIA